MINMNDIDKQIQKLEQILKYAERILITSHTSPDPDATASLLLLGTTLELNYPEKKIYMVLEEEPDGLQFLQGYERILFQSLSQAFQNYKPDLVIIVDANNFDRVSRTGGPDVRHYMSDNKAKLVILDHHLPDDKETADYYSNKGNPAAVQEVYEVCFDELGLKKPDSYAQTAMAGLYSDSGGFAYNNPRYEQTFKLAARLVSDGANIDLIKNRLNQYSQDQIKVLGELMNNLTHQDDYTYSFLSKDFVHGWVQSNKSLPALHMARKRFVNDFSRNIDSRKWGFVVSLDPQEGEGSYSVSFRSQAGEKDVSKLANSFGGGGHKASAGADLKAVNLNEAIDKVKEIIKNDT